MASAHYHCPSSLVLRSEPSIRLVQNLKLKSSNNSWLGTKVRVQPCSVSSRPHVSVSQRRPLVATVCFSLPTSNPERVSPSKEIPKWSSKAIKSFAMARLEARKLKYTTTGTEALLMGILIEADGGEITTAHIILGIWSELDSPGHKILSSLGFNDDKAKELESTISKHSVTDE